MSVWMVTDRPHGLQKLAGGLSGSRVIAPSKVDAALDAGGTPYLIINWAGLDGNDPPVRTLNRRRALALLQNPDVVRERLQLGGFRSLPRAQGLRSHGGVGAFRVGVLDMEVYAVRRLIYSRGALHSTARLLVGRRIWERVTGAALRALHVIGLDAAVVDVLVPMVREHVRPAILGIRLTPVLAGTACERLQALIRQRLTGPVRAESGASGVDLAGLTLGADPELMLRHRSGGHLIPASSLFSRRGRVGCDTQSGNRSGEFPIAEVRPGPRRHPDRLVREIRRCLMRAVSQAPYKDIEWLAGARPFPGYGTGGHIHFKGADLSGRLVRALDNYLAVPVFMVEPPEQAAARRLGHGFLGDIRLKKHGGFEYRTLPSWLVAPAVARAVLHLAWLIAGTVTAGAASLLDRDLFQDGEWVRAFYAGQKEPFYTVFDELWSDLTRLPGFAASAEALAPLRQMITERVSWPDARDIRLAWLLPAGLTSYPSHSTAVAADTGA
ncbi:MAG: hypothetical protein WD535_01315 [Thermaerobacterales bacterium]